MHRRRQARDIFELTQKIRVLDHDRGGPVVDVTGKIIGVTLARANRVASYAVTYQDLRPVIERLRHKAEVKLVKTNATPAQEAE